jgi:hypothetical protein
MSVNSVRETLTNNLLKVFQKEENVETRKELVSRPQIIYMRDLVWLDITILEMMARKHIPDNKFKRYNTAANLAKARKLANAKQDIFVKKLQKSNVEQTHIMRHLSIKAPKVYDAVMQGEAYIVSSFSTAQELKREIVATLVTRKRHLPFVDEISKRGDVGHGEEEEGRAVASVQIIKGAYEVFQVLNEEERKEFTTSLTSYADGLFESGTINISELSLIKSLEIAYTTVIGPNGKVSAEYVPILGYQDKYSNQAVDAPREQKLKNMMEKFFLEVGVKSLAEMEGSDSLNTQIAKKSLEAFIKAHGTIIGSKLVLDKKLSGPIKGSKGTAESKGRGKGTTSVFSNKRAVGKPIGGTKSSTRASKSNHTLTRLLPLINAKLPDTLAKNMTSPSLNYRTGRFAESVRAVDVTKTKKGFASVGYTYDKFPYQTFEMGYAQGSPTRDPRKLIDRSIREIAAGLAISRLFTRRL